MKKGFKMMGKIALMVLLPLIFISMTGIIISGRNQEKAAYALVEEKLEAVAYNVEEMLDISNDGEYTYEDEQLYKGDRNLTEDSSLIDEIKKTTGLEVTLFWGDMRATTTVTGSDGKRATGTKLDADFVKEMLNGNLEKSFTKDIEIAGDAYCGYYRPLKQTDGTIVGMIFVGRSREDVKKDILTGQLRVAGGMFICFVITFFVIVFLVGKIVKALKHTIGSLNDVASGKLDFDMQEQMLARADEIGEMSQSIQGLLDEFKDIVSDLKGSSERLADFSQEFGHSFDQIAENISNINIAIDEVASGATSQAGETMEAGNQIGRMGVAIEETSEDIRNLDRNSVTMRRYSDEAEDTLNALVEISHQTSEAIRNVQEQTNLTNDSAQAIAAATDMITSIAAQTNMLSLNASIEAARAGENGKGFAVVADQIRELSEQSRESADQIMHIVSELIKNSNTSVHTMDQVSGDVAIQNEKLTNTMQMFTSLNAEIDAVAQGVEKIRKSMEQLETAKQTVTESVEQLAAIAEENAASTEETSASMTELRNIVKQCQEETQQLTEISVELSGRTSHFTV